jgi:hypothetical protein
MRSRFIPLALALCAATAFAFALHTAWWITGDIEVGPFGARTCIDGRCSGTFVGIGPWLRAAIPARVAGYVVLAVLVFVAGALAARRIPRLMARTLLVALATALATGAYFAFGTEHIGAPHLGVGMFCFAGGIVLGTAAAILTLRAPDLR